MNYLTAFLNDPENPPDKGPTNPLAHAHPHMRGDTPCEVLTKLTNPPLTIV